MTAFTVSGAALHEAAAWASRVIPARPTAPVLAGLLLDAGDQLTITGYDWETRASATVACTTTVPGRLLLSGRLLAAVAKTISRGQDVAIEQDQDGPATVRAGRAEWELPVLPVAEYPTLPDLNEPVGAVQGDPLRQALGRVLPAVSHEPTLPMLNGVHVETAGDRLTLVATDRFRLAVATIPWQPVGDAPVTALVPGALFDAAARAVGDQLVSVLADDAGFGIATDDRLVSGRQVALEYLRWRHILGDEPGAHRAIVDAESLAEAIGQALVTAESGTAVDGMPVVRLDFAAGEVLVSGEGKHGRTQAAAEAQLDGDPIRVQLRAAYLRDALAAHGSDKVAVHFRGGNKPLLVLGDDPGYQHLLMPVRLPGDAA